jgi:hypothetical protein
MKRWLLVGAAGLAIVATGRAQAQTIAAPPVAPSPQMQICQRLEAQLAALDGSNGGRGEQIRRYEEAANRQQAELDRTVAQARRMGCEGSGFFLFGGQPPQCGPLNNQIQQMRANLDRMLTDLQKLQGNSASYEADSQRRAVLAALGRNDCGPQYRAAAAAAPPPQPQTQQPRGLFDTLFGPRSVFAPQPSGPVQSSTYRTICVRTCDGFYYPISFATTPDHFRDDERQCQRLCPASEVILFSYPNPGGDVSQAVSASGRLYTELPNAFRYRQEYNPACSCRAPGQSWADALKGLDDRSTIERGDIVVTHERAKAMSIPRDAKGRPLPAPTAGTKSDAIAATPAPAEATAPVIEGGKKPVRVVGPNPYPVR